MARATRTISKITSKKKPHSPLTQENVEPIEASILATDLILAASRAPDGRAVSRIDVRFDASTRHLVSVVIELAARRT